MFGCGNKVGDNMREFNTTGICFPDEHYMVNIDERIARIDNMINSGKYFYINRGRQYGKTTTLSLMREKLQDKYIIFSISFEGLPEEEILDASKLFISFFRRLSLSIKYSSYINDDIRDFISEVAKSKELSSEDFSEAISRLVYIARKKVVVLIDEVDQAGNYDSFIIFMKLLRMKYLERRLRPTFHSVILAGVYDIQNLKLRIRPDNEHQMNSPWNIAVRFDEDMSLSEHGIANMLAEYAVDRNISMDIVVMAKLLREYTSGYPFLVSRICQIIDTHNFSWNKTGFLEAIKEILVEKNTLFDDMIKKLDDFPILNKMLYNILYNGTTYPYSPDNKEVSLATMFGYAARDEYNRVKVSNRIFELRLYNKYILDEATSERIFNEGAYNKQRFIADNQLDMKKILNCFVNSYNEIYGDNDFKFLEKMGRKLFILFIKPIINGVGNYYIEAQTRDETRTDLIIDYCGHQYVIEMKIWRGEEYNSRGEKQLKDYLDYFNQNTGYMVSFNFNKNKIVGVHEINIDDKRIIEAVV